MIKLCLQRGFRPTAEQLSLRFLQQVPSTIPNKPPKTYHRLVPSCWMGTHGRNEPREPLNSPKRAKEFIYRLQPTERTCLLKQLQSFESIAIAQGECVGGGGGGGFKCICMSLMCNDIVAVNWSSLSLSEPVGGVCWRNTLIVVIIQYVPTQWALTVKVCVW